MTLHEDLFNSLLKKYTDANQSLDRVITDPRFKELPLEQKVGLLQEHGHTIQSNSRVDKKFWNDIAMGTVGSALMLYEPLVGAVGSLTAGIDYGVKRRQAYDAGEDFSDSPKKLDLKSFKSLALSATGAGLAAPKFYSALAAHRNMKMVKSLLKAEPGTNTVQDAINVLSRS